jgi:hypothetical protein
MRPVASAVYKQFFEGHEPAALGEDAGFLAYVACRIRNEIGCYLRSELTEAETSERIGRLSVLALEILGTRIELEAWLAGVTRATELSEGPGRFDRATPSVALTDN